MWKMWKIEIDTYRLWTFKMNNILREKCPYLQFFWLVFLVWFYSICLRINTKYGKVLIRKTQNRYTFLAVINAESWANLFKINNLNTRTTFSKDLINSICTPALLYGRVLIYHHLSTWSLFCLVKTFSPLILLCQFNKKIFQRIFFRNIFLRICHRSWSI